MRGLFAAGFVVVLVGCGSFGTNDAASAPDAGPPDAGPPDYSAGFCGRQPKTLYLCDDFDVGPLGFNWAETAVTGGVLELVDTSRSAPKGMVAGSLQSTNGQAWAYLRKDLTDNANHVVVAFDMKIENRGTTYTEGPGVTFGDRGGDHYSLSLVIAPNGSIDVIEVDKTGELARHSFAKTPVPGEWARIEMDVDLGAKSLRVRVDDASVPTIDAQMTVGQMSGAQRSLVVGLDYFLVPDWRVIFDNVTCDLR